MAQLCHLNAKLKNERPCFQCKSTSLELVSRINWYLNVQLGNHTKAAVTWPVDERYLFIDNPVISENGYIKRPNIYWSRFPEGSTRLTTLELLVFGVEAPRLSCDCWGVTFYSESHNIKPLQELYESSGLDPFSDDVARAAGTLLPRHLKLRNPKQKRRHSFTVQRDIILDRDEFRDGGWESYRYRRPKDVGILQESSSHLGIRVPVHWQLLAAAEVLPESLRWYDLRTTGHEFEYGEVNMDPKYDELPSRCRDFMHECQYKGKSLDEMVGELRYAPSSSLEDSAFGKSSKFLSKSSRLGYTPLPPAPNVPPPPLLPPPAVPKLSLPLLLPDPTLDLIPNTANPEPTPTSTYPTPAPKTHCFAY
ncbi:hypothetical protein M422DRAFT_248706 [Sphaerobolus stellatus SS14]|nr:hypothetical protein M422DRAFT_248706 [Sphaerobolus stellatus SS14]